jgi:hypothetical protein
MSSLITINHIALRGKSTLNISSDMCAICREHVCDKCIKCANGENPKNSQKMCFSVLGKCNHAYHQCCIQGWTNGLSSVRQKCPMCNNAWAIKERSINSNKNNYKNIIKKNISVEPNNDSEQDDESDDEDDENDNDNNNLINNNLINNNLNNNNLINNNLINNNLINNNLNNNNSTIELNIDSDSDEDVHNMQFNIINNINPNIINANINLINNINLNTNTNQIIIESSDVEEQISDNDSPNDDSPNDDSPNDDSPNESIIISSRSNP